MFIWPREIVLLAPNETSRPLVQLLGGSDRSHGQLKKSIEWQDKENQDKL